MDIELIDRTWACLPKEFKEEVKETYREYTEKIATTSEPEYRIVGYIAAQTELELLFGKHNLTSDAEGEEMLMCEKSKIQKVYNTSREIVKAENPDSLMYSMHTQIMCVLENIFGSKCLPDELNEDNFATKKPKPAEPKEDKHFDNILKDDFRDHNRLHIAAILAAGMLASEVRCYPVDRALELADKLIAECEKGDNHA